MYRKDRQFFHKWALLTDPDDVGAGAKGYLKCDISVIGKGDAIKVPPKSEKDEDDIEANLLLPEGVPIERQRARFIVTIHKADGLPKMNYSLLANVKRAFTGESQDLVDPYVQVCFAGMTGSTSVRKNSYTPVWNEQIVFTEMFPPLCQRIKLQLRDNVPVNPNVIGTHFIDLKTISNDGDRGFLPTFGPAYIYMYGSTRDYSLLDQHAGLNMGMGEGVSYRGRLLVSIRTEIIDGIECPLSDVEVEPIPPINESSFEKNEEFFLFASIFEANMIDKRLTDKPLQFELSLGNSGNSLDGHNESVKRPHDLDGELDELCADTGYWQSTTQPTKAASTDKNYYYLPYWDHKQCMHIRSIWPDHRRRMYNSNMIANIIEKYEEGLSDAQAAIDAEIHPDSTSVMMLKSTLESLSTACTAYVRHMANAPPLGHTKLDKERQKLCVYEIEQIAAMAKSLRALITKHSIKERLRTAYSYLSMLKHLCEDWPGKKSASPSGWSIPAKITVYLWLGILQHKKHYIDGLPQGYEVTSELRNADKLRSNAPSAIFYAEKHNFQMRAYVYQARSLIGSDSSGLSDPFARIVIGESSATTQVIDETLSPTWDELLVFDDVLLYSTIERIKADPPTIVIEIFDQDKVGKSEFIGRTLAKPRIKSYEDVQGGSQSAPSLEWHEITRGDDRAGELLATFELLEIPPKQDSSILPNLPSPREANGKPPIDTNKGPILPVPRGIRPTLSKYRIEVLFWGLRDLKRVHLLTVDRPRVDIECAGNILYSSVIQNAKRNPNFTNPIRFVDVELPEQDLYRPPLTIRVVDCRSFGRITLVGTHTINSIHKYIYTPMSKRERDIEERKKSLIPLQNVDLRANCIVPDDTFTIENEKESCPLLTREGRGAVSYGSGIKPQVMRKKFTKRESMKKRKTSTDSALDDDEGNKDWWTKYFASIESMIEEEKEAKKERQGFLQPSQAHCSSDLRSPRSEDIHSPKSSRERDRDRERNRRRQPTSPKPKVSPTLKKNEIPRSALAKIYPHELEAVPEYDEFKEWLHSFELYRGKKTGDDSEDENRVVGVFKGAIKVYKWPLPRGVDEHNATGYDPNFRFFQGVPNNEPIHVLVRVYIVKATDLHPMDLNGKADPYIVLHLGSKRISDKENYVSKQLNPVFGKCFEIEATFPQDSLLTIQVLDWDLLGADDLIGETKIDLENRFYSRHRATCGLPMKYEEQGYNRWRDAMKPTQILAKLCKDGKLDPPIYEYGRVKIGRIEQGRLQMWVDMFPMDMPLPGPPMDISARKPKSYEMRSTDIHYRSLTGEGNFNWRFIYPFDYLEAEERIVISRKESVFSWDETECKIPARLELQVWDADHFSADDFLDMLQYDGSVPMVNIFKQKRVKGWWPFYIKRDTEEMELTGKVEAEIHLLTREEADKVPAGLGRNEPDPLEKPNRPDASFMWFLNPLKSIRYIVWHNYKWTILKASIIILLTLMILLLVYAVPGYTVKKLLGA
ncbi:hypothetical protein HF086_002194 [Spodoptera exigua]|uniref:C2 domain-containing protein n=1 Tax=Spodoptera exigua TaxID=7107 RepID=A0A922MGX1_SPOEX|nr:hypothetical protein HF086_002194 [Spodoptera exigua]